MENQQDNRSVTLSHLVRWGGSILSTGLFIYVLFRVEWQHVFDSLSRIPAWLLLAAFGCYVAGMVLNALRWYVLLAAQKLEMTFWESLKLVFMGAFVSNFLPSTVGGDIARIAGSYRYTRSASLSASSVLLERLINMASMVTAVPFLSTLLKPGATFYNFWRQQGLSLPFAASSVWIKWRDRFSHRWSREQDAFKLAVMIWLKRPLTLVWAFVVAWGSNLIVFLGMWLLATRLGIPVRFEQVIGINVVVYFLTLLPISINGFGVKELSEISIYLYLGATLEQATIYTIITRFFSVTETLPGAFLLTSAIHFTPEGVTFNRGISASPMEEEGAAESPREGFTRKGNPPEAG